MTMMPRETAKNADTTTTTTVGLVDSMWGTQAIRVNGAPLAHYIKNLPLLKTNLEAPLKTLTLWEKPKKIDGVGGAR